MKKKSMQEKARKLTFRLDDEIAELLGEYAEAASIEPNLLGRMAVIQFVKNRLHQIPEKLVRVEKSHNQLVEAVIRLTKDFNEAVYREGE